MAVGHYNDHSANDIAHVYDCIEEDLTRIKFNISGNIQEQSILCLSIQRQFNIHFSVLQ